MNEKKLRKLLKYIIKNIQKELDIVMKINDINELDIKYLIFENSCNIFLDENIIFYYIVIFI